MSPPLGELAAHLRLLSCLLEEQISFAERHGSFAFEDSALIHAIAAAKASTTGRNGTEPPVVMKWTEPFDGLREASAAEDQHRMTTVDLVEEQSEVSHTAHAAAQKAVEAGPAPQIAWDGKPLKGRPSKDANDAGEKFTWTKSDSFTKTTSLVGLGSYQPGFLRRMLTYSKPRGQIGVNTMQIRTEELMEAVQRQSAWQTGEKNVHYENTLRGRCKRMVSNSRFDSFMALMICVNAIMMGLHANLKTGDKYLAALTGVEYIPREVLFYRVVDLTFTIIFTLEILIRIYAEGKDFFSPPSPSFPWNVFDTSIILFCVLDEVANVIREGAGISNSDVSVLRLLRTLRLARTLRILRVTRFFRDLRVMISGILHSIKSLIWALGLLLMVTYLFAVCIVETLCSPAIEAPEPVMFNYKSLGRAMYTLYKSVLGGVDWGDISDPFFEISQVCVVLFMLYVAFAVMCVLNIITGVFVENANKITAKAENDELLEELQKRKRWLEEAKNLFQKATGDGQTMNQEAFEELVGSVQNKGLFRKLGIELERQHASVLFRLIDFDDSGEVDLEEFITGVDQLHGTARSMDVVKIRHKIAKMDSKMSQILASLGNQTSKNSRGTKASRAAHPEVENAHKELEVKSRSQSNQSKTRSQLMGSMQTLG